MGNCEISTVASDQKTCEDAGPDRVGQTAGDSPAGPLRGMRTWVIAVRSVKGYHL